MKNSMQIIGLPIISISEGTEVGKVKSLVINPEKGTVDFLTIDHEDWQVSVKAIPFKKIIGIGEYAVTVDNANAVIDLNEIPIANQLLNKKVKIINTKVMTRKGQLLGELTEYFFDEESGQIIGANLKAASGEVVLPTETVLTYGRDIIIVEDDASKHFLSASEQLMEEEPVLAAEAEETATDEEQGYAASDSKIGDFDEVFRLKQLQLLEGKRVTRNIQDPNGKILFREGTVLSREDVKDAQKGDPGLLVELSMNVEA